MSNSLDFTRHGDKENSPFFDRLGVLDSFPHTGQYFIQIEGRRQSVTRGVDHCLWIVAETEKEAVSLSRRA